MIRAIEIWRSAKHSSENPRRKPPTFGQVVLGGSATGSYLGKGDGSIENLGDVNGDGNIDILDVVLSVNIILSGGTNSSEYTDCQKLDADLDMNGTINILDVIILINLIL